MTNSASPPPSPPESHWNHGTGATQLLEGLRIRIGPANTTGAPVYATFDASTPDASATDFELCGTLEGPFCQRGHTLKTRVHFRTCTGVEQPSARAFMPDPCFWSPELPHLYRAILTLRESGRPVAELQRWLGFRPIEVAGRRVYFEGRNWMLRAARLESLTPDVLASWREASLAAILPPIDVAEAIASPAVAPSQSSSPAVDCLTEVSSVHTLLLEAGREGVLCVARLRGDVARLGRTLWQLNGLPSLALAILDVEQPVALAPEHLPPNILLGQHAVLAPRPFSPAPWAHVVVCDVPAAAERLPADLVPPEIDRPLMACRWIEPLGNDARAARQQCDRLQRELAGTLDVSGLLIDAVA